MVRVRLQNRLQKLLLDLLCSELETLHPTDDVPMTSVHLRIEKFRSSEVKGSAESS